MSSATTAEADAVTVADTVEKAPRKFPPPCWTQEETLALIDAYRERWYALRRGYLRTADWDAVAAAVASRCPGASPAKTSAQCRHKMEKLRQRYRAEKQRALSFPYPAGRYFSSWFFFENMEAMENGTTPPTSVQKPENSADGSRLKSFLDQNILKLKLKAKNNVDSGPDLGYDNGIKAHRFNSGTRVPSEYSSYLDMDVADKEEEDMPQDDDLINFGRRKQPMNGIQKPSLKSKAKKSGKMFNNFDVSGGFHQEMLPPGLRIKKFGKFDPSMDSDNNRSNSNEEFWVKVSNNNNDNSNNFGAPGFRAKYWASLNPSPDSRAAMHGLKRGRNAVEEIVASIKLLGEGFVKMEKEKMEMAREMEAMRMEMEMKRNQMLLESQKQIVDAFLKGLFELKKSKKVNTGIAADSAEP
ncbi:hypothetical protein Pfo_004326 [Paulownia fortunei]|nr:hypothetical protein Pfo_004326 [Paulownia fortunei]